MYCRVEQRVARHLHRVGIRGVAASAADIACATAKTEAGKRAIAQRIVGPKVCHVLRRANGGVAFHIRDVALRDLDVVVGVRRDQVRLSVTAKLRSQFDAARTDLTGLRLAHRCTATHARSCARMGGVRRQHVLLGQLVERNGKERVHVLRLILDADLILLARRRRS